MALFFYIFLSLFVSLSFFTFLLSLFLSIRSFFLCLLLPCPWCEC